MRCNDSIVYIKLIGVPRTIALLRNRALCVILVARHFATGFLANPRVNRLRTRIDLEKLTVNAASGCFEIITIN